jgi:hypothetical protein
VERGKEEEHGRYILNTYVNITMCPTVQLLYVNEIIKK